MNEFKAGDVVEHPEHGRGLVRVQGERWVDIWTVAHSVTAHANELRPLVVIDPEDAEDMGDVLRVLLDNGWTGMGNDGLQRIFRKLAKPTPPPLTEEPGDLAARVIDGEGREWAKRRDGLWGCLTNRFYPMEWADLVAAYGPLRLADS